LEKREVASLLKIREAGGRKKIALREGRPGARASLSYSLNPNGGKRR